MPVGLEIRSFKKFPGGLPGGWSDLELTDTLDLHQFFQFLKYLKHYRYLNLTLQLQSSSSVDLSNKRTPPVKGGKD